MNFTKQKHPYLRPESKCALIMETDLAILVGSDESDTKSFNPFGASTQRLDVEFDAKSRFNFFEDDEEDYE